MAQTIAHDALAMVEYGQLPSILVLGDEGGATTARRIVDALGYRVCAAAPLDGAVERLRDQVATDAVVIAADRDHGDAFDRLLDQVETGVQAGRFRAVVAGPPELIDAVAARAEHAIHLCEADDLQWAAAIADAAARRPDRLHDVRREEGRLQKLSEEVGRIASVLASLSAEEAAAASPPPAPGEKAKGGIEAGQVRAIIRARRLRDQYFKAELFADPAWDMLLDLMAARLERQRVAVSSLCIAAAVPATTALRWIKTMTDEGLFVRRADPQDGRRVYIELSEGAAAGLEAYLKAAQRIAPIIV